MYQRLDEIVTALAPEALSTLRAWIQIPSVKEAPLSGAPFGAPVRAMLDRALEDAQALGFQTRNFDGYIGDVEMGAGERVMGILAHLDVVPAGDGWQTPPFGAVVENGKVYGRGTSDDKGPAVAALYAMKAVLQAGLTPKARVRLLLGCDEESGWQDIAYYKQQERMPDFGFSPDASYPVINTEKGIVRLSLDGALPGETGAARPVYCITAGERRRF
ncbi:MAG: Sapep family Mn(2+)-dependent dipeptidase [Clostridia bacterium]